MPVDCDACLTSVKPFPVNRWVKLAFTWSQEFQFSFKTFLVSRTFVHVGTTNNFSYKNAQTLVYKTEIWYSST